jgi:signal transduction histidine kinase
VSPLLAAASIRLIWQVDPTIQMDGVGPEVVLNLFRILQEAVNNCVRHALAKNITISVTQNASEVNVRVQDDGGGFDPAAISVGHYGLAGMRLRAQKIGALIQFFSNKEQGTNITLTWPRVVAS